MGCLASGAGVTEARRELGFWYAGVTVARGAQLWCVMLLWLLWQALLVPAFLLVLGEWPGLTRSHLLHAAGGPAPQDRASRPSPEAAPACPTAWPWLCPRHWALCVSWTVGRQPSVHSLPPPQLLGTWGQSWQRPGACVQGQQLLMDGNSYGPLHSPCFSGHVGSPWLCGEPGLTPLSPATSGCHFGPGEGSTPASFRQVGLCPNWREWATRGCSRASSSRSWVEIAGAETAPGDGTVPSLRGSSV